MPPFRWGIVGFGWVARDYFAPAALAAGHRVTAVFDPGAEAQMAARALGAAVVGTVADLARHVDAVYVATPNNAHRAAVEACAAARLPLLCEKPMAATLADAEAMADAVRATGVPYGTAFDQRWHPAHDLMRAVIERGELGTVTAVRIVYGCWVGDGWAADNWRIDRARAGGGAAIDLAPHGLDLAGFLLSAPVTALQARLQRRIHAYPVDDGALLTGGTGSGVLVQAHVAYNMPETLPRRRLEVVGTAGMLLAEDTMGQTGGGRLTFIRAADGAHEDVPFAPDSPFQRQAVAFADYVRGECPGVFDLERDLALNRVLMQALA